MNFVKDDNRPLDLLKEKLRVGHGLGDAGRIAVQVEAFRLWQRPREGCFPHAPHACQPGMGMTIQ